MSALRKTVAFTITLALVSSSITAAFAETQWERNHPRRDQVSCSVLAFKTRTSVPSFCAAACKSLNCVWYAGVCEFRITAIVEAVGTNSCRSPSRLPSNSSTRILIPVALPPGRLKLATRPALMGSFPDSNTIGMVVVAA